MNFFDGDLSAQIELGEYARSNIRDLFVKRLKKNPKKYNISKKRIENIYTDDFSWEVDRFSLKVLCFDEDKGEVEIGVFNGKFFYQDYYDYINQRNKVKAREFVPSSEKEARELIDYQVDEFVENLLCDKYLFCF